MDVIHTVTYVKIRTLEMPASLRKPRKETMDSFVVDKNKKYRIDEITSEE